MLDAAAVLPGQTIDSEIKSTELLQSLHPISMSHRGQQLLVECDIVFLCCAIICDVKAAELIRSAIKNFLIIILCARDYSDMPVISSSCCCLRDARIAYARAKRVMFPKAPASGASQTRNYHAWKTKKACENL